MLTSDPRDALVLAHGYAQQLRQEAAARQLRRSTFRSSTRRAFAGSLRRAANRLDPGPLAHDSLTARPRRPQPGGAG